MVNCVLLDISFYACQLLYDYFVIDTANIIGLLNSSFISGIVFTISAVGCGSITSFYNEIILKKRLEYRCYGMMIFDNTFI